MNCNISTSVRNKTMRFFKDGTEWYADVPNHTLAQNRMVAGADVLLESMANGKDELRICLSSDLDDPDAYRIKMRRIDTIRGARRTLRRSRDVHCRAQRGFATSRMMSSGVNTRRLSTFTALQRKEA